MSNLSLVGHFASTFTNGADLQNTLRYIAQSYAEVPHAEDSFDSPADSEVAVAECTTRLGGRLVCRLLWEGTQQAEEKAV
ncbi:hypothetical protein BKA70DRAFT_1558492 [Coprinopsis sp. MPI-PUGE-AT-0042]|nr:hypothetical protein BKA70DRAFT_1558492 [Coprinopsis sp. MPI-PUGE-AT-0042]